MQSNKRAWLLAVCGSKDAFPNEWLDERRDLLKTWEVGGENTPGIKTGDHFFYYVPGDEKRLIAAGRAAGGVSSEMEFPVQLHLVIPRVQWGPVWTGRASGVIGGKRAALLEDGDYEAGLDLLLTWARERFKS